MSPPSFLAPKSVTEIPSCWTEQPSAFAAPAKEADPAKRALLVTRLIIGALKSQYYIGENSKIGIKKPLNAFLGELFVGKFEDANATTHLVSEQVSHHPPVTACYMWDEENGIQCEGYSEVEITFNGNINVKQTGRALLHIDEYDEDYQIPIMDAKVKGFLSGRVYPELSGTYSIVSSSGYISEVKFCGQGYLTGQKNHFTASIYHRSRRESPIYTMCGEWNGKYKIYDCAKACDIETCNTNSTEKRPVILPSLPSQDPWETRRAWDGVLKALHKGDMQTTSSQKTKLEEAQRRMRRREAAKGVQWKPIFFYQAKDTATAEKANKAGVEKSHRVWKADRNKAMSRRAPYHGSLTPMG